MSDDETPILNEPPSDNKFIDELTMKLLSNQSSYAKYLSKTDTLKYEEHQQFKVDCKNLKGDILSMTRELLTSKENEYGSSVNEAFNNYARILIRHLEVTKQSNDNQREYEEEIFPYSMDEDNKPNKRFEKMNTLDSFLKKK